MSDIVLRGMTWDHRRAIDPLVSTMPGFRARRSDVDIFWTARPLHGFEFDPVQELAQQFDLIVLITHSWVTLPLQVVSSLSIC
jgi:multiple sugar transport system substrate-binding protein